MCLGGTGGDGEKRRWCKFSIIDEILQYQRKLFKNDKTGMQKCKSLLRIECNNSTT